MQGRAIQDLTQALTKALPTGDFALYRSILTLRMWFAPTNGKADVLCDEAALRADFDLYVTILKQHGVTDIYRKLQNDEPGVEGEAVVRWLTHILVRANLLANSFERLMRLRWNENGWRIAEIESTRGHLN